MDIKGFETELKALIQRTVNDEPDIKEAINRACGEVGCPDYTANSVNHIVSEFIQEEFIARVRKLTTRHLIGCSHSIVQECVVNYQGTDVIKHTREDIEEYAKEFATVVGERMSKGVE